MIKLIASKEPQKFEVDASLYTYGDLCQRVAYLLLGKGDTKRNFNYFSNEITVKKLEEVQLSHKRKENFIVHHRHSGYPGGLKIRSFKYYKERGLLHKCFLNSLRTTLPKNKRCNKLLGQNIKFM